LPLLDGVRNPWPRSPLPDVQQYSLHEYGNRVGFWRVLEVLDHYQIRCSTTLNIGVLQHFPDIAEAMLKRDWTFVNHGFYNTRYITAFSEEQEERDYIQTAIQALTRATGTAPVGWLGPESGESARMPQVLAECGIHYVCDWVNDEQPYSFKVPQGELYALPIALPLDDVNALWDRRIDIDRYREMIKET